MTGEREGPRCSTEPMQRLAIHTCGVLVAPYHHLVNRAFMESVGPVFDGAHEAQGFIMKLDEPYDVARFPMVAAVTSDPTCVITTLSLWCDLSAARQFSFLGTHARALARRREWFLATPWPSHVAWWVSGAVPGWDEAYERLCILVREGPCARAFTLQRAFTADGVPDETPFP